MSIADKLTYLNDTKSLLREAINAAGGNLTQETPFREYVGGWLRDQSASLILDFSKQQYVAKDKVSMFPDRVGFEDIVTFTRSTGGGRFNAQGQYEWVEANVPRIDYDPVTGECKGLLIEEQRTNLIPYSESPGSWASVEADIFPRVDGGTTVSSGVVTTATRRGILDVPPVATAIPNTQHTKTIVVENISAGIMWVGGHWGFNNYARQAGMVMDFTDMSVKYVGPKVLSYKVEPVGGEKYSITITSDLLEYTNTLGLYFLSGVMYNYNNLGSVLNIATDVAREFVFHRAQREIGSFPTTYIPTEGAQVTRAADIATVNDLAPWYSPNQGSFSIKAKGHIGEPLLTAGDAFIIADSDELKEYQVSYSEDPQATQVDIGKGLIESIRYWPRETA